MAAGPMRQRLLSLALGLGMMLLGACTSLPPAPALPSLPVPSRAASLPATAVQLPVETEGSQSAARPPDTVDATGLQQDSQELAGEPVKALERGLASWYGQQFHGRRTASGERYDMRALTAAHRTLPFGTLVRVRHLASGREVDVRITDRGPFRRERVIDVSRAAAEALGMIGHGVSDVLLLVPESVSDLPLPPSAQAKRRRSSRPKLR